jgi:hypothetical protein
VLRFGRADTPSGDYSFDFKLSSGKLKVDVGNGSGCFLTGPGIPFGFQLNRWYMVAAVVQPSFVTLYVNGRSIGTEAYPTGDATALRPVAPRLPRYKRSPPVRAFRGHMDEVAIYQTPLTSDEINGPYHAGIGR